MKRIAPRFRRFVAMGLSVLLLVSLFVMPAAAVTKSEINDLKGQAEELEQQKADMNRKVDRLKKDADSKLEEKALLEQQVGLLMGQIAVSEQLLADLKDQIEESQKELEEATEKESAFYEEFCDRFRDMEEQSTVSYWSILFGSASFADFLDRLVFVREVAEYDNQLLDELREIRQEVETARNDLLTSQADQEKAQRDLEGQKESLAKQEKAVEAALAEIEANQDTYAGQLANLQAEASKLDDEIASAERKYKEEHSKPKPTPPPPPPAEDGGEKPSVSPSGMVWPCSSHRVTSPFGSRPSPTPGASTFHNGIDIGAPAGSPVYAAASGTVLTAGYSSARGYYVEISHGNGMKTVYMHCKALYVSSGAQVSAGQHIAAVGSTGISTGPHLHFGVMVNGSYQNPLDYVG